MIIDYQNVHLVGHDAFPSTRYLERHTSLIDPLLFSYELIKQRNARQRPGYSSAILQEVWVYRGLPSSEYDPDDNARSMAQQHHWERDRRVHVQLRPLRYRLERDATGRPMLDVNGNVTIVEKREKGVDVLCALAVVREAARQDIDLVILASHDSDLEPAIDEARELTQAKIETFRWNSPDSFVYQLRSGDRSRPIWCTKLDERSFRPVGI
ncbi:MAG: NYN domain-containing protein [Propioniciclava sp.]|uniref:hypothetical protein n=1 Tax=Propioniciclava sp. TaxID=2038686 RepID=UPI0039E3025F